MAHLLKCEPNVIKYFNSIALSLVLYVGSSIIIPALSERHLDTHNRRHWNLLKVAKSKGVNLKINELILNELIAHFYKTKNIYNTYYKDKEDFFIKDEMASLYIEEILIRAYFYARIKGQVNSFEKFFDNFLSYDMKSSKIELIEFLNEEFGIEYISSDPIISEIDMSEYDLLYEELKKHKRSEKQAECDAKLILNIYNERRINNELGKGGILGCKTWWLSKDEITYRIALNVLNGKYTHSCYMRPDFLYNYIAMAPNLSDIKESYENLFPTLLGVSISNHINEKIVKRIHEFISEYHDSESIGRIRGKLRSLGEKIRTYPSKFNESKLELYLEDLKNDLIKDESIS